MGENCHVEFGPCANTGCDWKWGAWGEDVFAQRCMDHHYVDKVEAFDLATDGACKADRPEGEKENKKWHPSDCSKVTTVTAHPFKKPAEWIKCFDEMTGRPSELAPAPLAPAPLAPAPSSGPGKIVLARASTRSLQ